MLVEAAAQNAVASHFDLSQLKQQICSHFDRHLQA